MNQRFNPKRRLGYRILRWVLAIALLSGIALSAGQIVVDARRVSDGLDQQAKQTLALVRDAATQAIYSIDDDLGRQVIEGLFEQRAMHGASIEHPDGTVLAEKSGELRPSSYRSITDPIFEAQREYRIPLQRAGGDRTIYGYLNIHYDTAYAARDWLERATLTLLTGLARALVLALVLFLVFHLLLTRPLLRIIRSVSDVDPEAPGDHLLDKPQGHRDDELGVWVNATNNLLTSITESQERHAEAKERINRLSRYDKLTGLPNREMLMGMLRNAIHEHRRAGQHVAIYCCGIDDFKSINEQYGYHIGDGLLQVLAERISQDSAHGPVLAARLGSDQFVVVEQNLRDGYQCASTCDWLLYQISRPVRLGDMEVGVSATVGIALYPDDAEHTEQLLQRAEQTMTLAKTAGRNHYQFYVAQVDEEIRERKRLEKDLMRALPDNQLHLVYQPQINLGSRRIVGAEALLRWTHPTLGMVPPDRFIPLAELNGSIVEIGRWVLEEACRQAAEWAAAEMPLHIAINLSAVQLRQGDIVETILNVLKAYDIPPGRLELEVTETSFMENLDSAVEKLNQLKREGVNVAVDDFGTGYSSLTYLKRLPVQHLKIDKQFVQDLLINDDDTRIANTIIDLGRSLNLDVIAEGVETEEQEFYLHSRGCQMAQGYYFAKPLPADDFVRFYASFHHKAVASASVNPTNDT
ncbi:diguanylate cyclase/phosphodiesterase [Tamilnaduibacter salinus]|uniref:cyclic-guanylate-specific phosphodiesterase n=1 Tax=Tamilnaduibacter salinus TaxID=1484056 RepID=A0A2U1D1G8_9GAMM|nr:GGDEF domain-containing phosphodiesterase [Tamilnaduibacter salinus]PVY79219.1 diguanylate cyclase/phosphodiesterase [Tamilnaduibacter salinus]